jgi:lysophospholipase L1-like esterase
VHTWRGTRLALAAAVIGVVAVAAAGLAQAVAEPDSGPYGTDRAVPCGGNHWTVAWLAAPQSSSLGRPDDGEGGLADGRARTFVDQSLRMIVTPHAAGGALRVHLGNRYGSVPLTLSSVSIGAQTGGAAVDGSTLHAVTFSGERSVVIPAGGEVVSDALFAPVQPFRKLSVSFTVPGAAPLDLHQWGQQTSYVSAPQSGDHADDTSGAAYVEQVETSFAVAAVDVLAPRYVGAVVALGDSITDGVGSTPGADHRWPDQLTRRILDATAPLTVVDAGLGGNQVAGTTPSRDVGAPMTDRVERDVVEQAGVTDLVLFGGVNDLFTAADGLDVARGLIDGYREIIATAHAANVRVSIATITPAGLAPAKEAARQTVNEWIRTSRVVDRVIDFDRVVRNPDDPTRLRPSFDAAMAHLTDAGYQTMADAVDLKDFQGTGCRS